MDWIGVRRSIIFSVSLVSVSTILVTGVYQVMSHLIEEGLQREHSRLVFDLLSQYEHDNDALNDYISVVAKPLFQSQYPGKIYRVMSKGCVIGLVTEVVALEGYGGSIRLLLAVDNHQKILGVRILQHTESPRIGDYIDQERYPADNWVGQFTKHSLHNTSWGLKGHGGEFVYYAGATISPRAVVIALDGALRYIEKHSGEWYTCQSLQEMIYE